MSTRLFIPISPLVHGDTTVTDKGIVVKNLAAGEVFSADTSVNKALVAAPLSTVRIFYLKGTTGTVNLTCSVSHTDRSSVPATPMLVSDSVSDEYTLAGAEGQENSLDITTPLTSFSSINENDRIGLGFVRDDTDTGDFYVTGVEFEFNKDLNPATRRYTDYIEELQSLIKDDAAKLTTTVGGDLDKILAKAVRDYSGHKPFFVRKKVQGNGTSEYLLSDVFGSLWMHGSSWIREIEYPIGNNPRELLDSSLYEIYDDGTDQDGSNLKLRLVDSRPDANSYFVAEVNVGMSLPRDGTQNFPDTDENFSNITVLAAAYACQRLAAAYAQSSDATISADVVNYHDKSSRYQSLARQYLKQYNLSVFGKEDPEVSVDAAIVSKPMRSSDAWGAPYLFHKRKDDLSGSSRF
jgi:hypothetical protein